MTLEVDEERVVRELEELSTFSETAPPAVTRVVFSPQDLDARAWIKRLCEKADLRIREDGVGNTFARWEGTDSALEAVATGSHIDAIPNSGRYDGTVGVLGALEAIRALRQSGFTPRRSLELILFTSEEPTRFGIGCLGSRLLSASLAPEHATQLRDRDNCALDELRQRAGFEQALDDVPLRAGTYQAFLELHIEQGPILEREQIAIGVVTHIAAPASLRITISGEGGHAGAVLMSDRRDALSGAAEFALAVESAALATGSRDSVATTGALQVFPGAVNSVPSQVKLEVDVRDTDLARRDGMVNSILSSASRICGKRHLECRTEIVNADAPAICDCRVVSVITEACDMVGCTYTPLVSRAYHDSLFMARIAPTGMIFIPCRNGVSHRPDEYASPQHIRLGIAVLAHALAKLAS